MDPITAAILAVLPALASDTLKGAVKDAYDGLKAVIRRKWGDTAPISKAVDALEADPGSKAQAAVLSEKVEQTKAANDSEVIDALKALVAQMETHGMKPSAGADVQFTMTGGTVQGVAGAGSVEIGTQTFGTPPNR